MTNPFHPYNPPKLTIELVPASQWGDNLRSHLRPNQWNALRYACYQKAHHRCEICNGKGTKHPVECHEIWDYNDSARVQTLLGLISLCPACHQVKHIGLAAHRGMLGKAMLHLMNVNEWPADLAEQYIMRQFEIHSLRSQFEWSIDLSWLKNIDVYIKESELLVRQRAAKHTADVLAAMTRKR